MNRDRGASGVAIKNGMFRTTARAERQDLGLNHAFSNRAFPSAMMKENANKVYRSSVRVAEAWPLSSSVINGAGSTTSEK